MLCRLLVGHQVSRSSSSFSRQSASNQLACDGDLICCSMSRLCYDVTFWTISRSALFELLCLRHDSPACCQVDQLGCCFMKTSSKMSEMSFFVSDDTGQFVARKWCQERLYTLLQFWNIFLVKTRFVYLVKIALFSLNFEPKIILQPSYLLPSYLLD